MFYYGLFIGLMGITCIIKYIWDYTYYIMPKIDYSKPIWIAVCGVSGSGKTTFL